MKKIKKALITTIKSNLPILVAVLIGLTSCKKDDDPVLKPVVIETPQEEEVLSDKKEITSFVFLLANNPIDINVVATIDEENKTITAAMPPGTDLSGLLPEVKISALATVNLDTAQDFTVPKAYTVTAEDDSQTVYTVTITALLTQRQILRVILDANPENLLSWDLQNTEDLGALDGVVTNSERQIIELLLANKNLIAVPKEIGQLTHLSALYLEFNELSSIPSEIGQLINLVHLSIGFNDISAIPVEIGQLKNVTHLDAGSNQLNSIPSEVGQMNSLTNLDVGSNQLSSIPSEIGQLIDLEFLNLANNQLAVLTSEIGQLTNLIILTLSNNQLTSLPPEIGLLSELGSLGLESNRLEALPTEIGGLGKLRHLFASFNLLTFLPPDLGKLTNLQTLGLTGNRLTTLPAEIGFLVHLNELFIASNEISTLPVSICFLPLFHNVVIHNDLTFTCETTSQKDALISIYSANPDNTLGWGVDNYPEVTFDANGSPITITMNNKNLTRIPNSIDQLDQLEVLNINGNNLTNLPATLGTINALTSLTAAGNNLSTVPSEFGGLNNLSLLSLTQNPITNLPQEVCDLQRSLTILTDPGKGCN